MVQQEAGYGEKCLKTLQSLDRSKLMVEITFLITNLDAIS